ncbi:MAG: [FeFe] hydrogenase H-cluster radical SAM maturase HydE [Victivallales bacterium]|nr:[FeFe] hydrogenase H-cluster radical SAM maturase HydE [Victivallales bacterium]
MNIITKTHPTTENILVKAQEHPFALSHEELRSLLALEDTDALFQTAYRLKCSILGKKVALRGIVEMGNVCAKNCYYCGIRHGNTKVSRYQLSEDDVVRMAKWCYDMEYGSVVLQSGEIESDAHTELIERIIRRIHEFGGDSFGITLSLGEQSEEAYRRWLVAGAHRYLLRIETSNPTLYERLHPSDHSHNRRMECLRVLKRLGYQTGSGVMIGLPGQTLDDLANDIIFYHTMDLDMIGMGPYLPHHDTPLGKGIALTSEYAANQLKLGLKMIAVTRLFLHDVNIAATTALQALDERGRELGILAGANVMMPNATDTEYRPNYQLYENKPCLDENSQKCRNCLNWRVIAIGEKIAWNVRGDSPHFKKNLQKERGRFHDDGKPDKTTNKGDQS